MSGARLNYAVTVAPLMEIVMRTALAVFLLTLVAVSAVAASVPTIAIVDFTSSDYTDLVTKIPEFLSDELVNSGRFSVVEREKVASFMDELMLSQTGLMDMNKTVQLGKLTGASYVLTGNLIDFGAETRDYQIGNYRGRTTFFRLRVAVKILDVETGKILFSTRHLSEKKQHEGQNVYISDSRVPIALAEQSAAEIVQKILSSEAFNTERTPTGKIRITVTSKPSGADVEINGVFYGNAGAAFEVPEGLNEIKVSLPGYEVWTKKVQCREGLEFTAHLTEAFDTKIKVSSDGG